MHVLIVGGQGLLGRALCSAHSGKHRVTTWTRTDQDITSPATSDAVAEVRPDVVVNAAAWTDVDAAERNSELAYAVNALGPKYLAEGCSAIGAALIQVSTNEVFSGLPGRYYHEYDVPEPGGVYARSKYGGELAAGQLLERLYVVRVSWLYGVGGNHFPAKIAAAADNHGALKVVADEHGNPTYAADAANAIWRLAETHRYGTYHLVNEGFASRYEFAKTVLEETGRGTVPIEPIPSSEWARSTKPPLHAVLCNQTGAALGIRLRPWKDALVDYLRHDGERFRQTGL